MEILGHTIAVCSWSLQAKGMSELVDKVRQTGLQHLQLAFAPLLALDQKQRLSEIARLHASGLALTGGMISFPGEDYASIATIRKTGGYVPDDAWPDRRAASDQAAHLAKQLGVKTVTTHVGFVPPAGDPAYSRIRDRVLEVATLFAQAGVDLLMETGQEKASELLEFLQDLHQPNVFINFDPANMILYGAGNPIPAIPILGRYIRHVHVKDAAASAQPGEQWGAEVPFGTGQVGPAAFLRALRDSGYAGPLAIEREAGQSRVDDVRAAITALAAV